MSTMSLKLQLTTLLVVTAILWSLASGGIISRTSEVSGGSSSSRGSENRDKMVLVDRIRRASLRENVIKSKNDDSSVPKIIESVVQLFPKQMSLPGRKPGPFENTLSVSDCFDPPPVTNGNRDFDCTVQTCQVTYTCDSGYFLDGVDSRTCQANGQWSGNSPTCPLIDCYDPPTVANGNRDFNCTVEACEVTYTCDSGYFRVGVENRTCQSDGKWSEDAPTCSQLPKEVPMMPRHW